MDNEKIDMINRYLKEQLWMEFQLGSASCSKLELCGFLDEAEEDKIKISFSRPCAIICSLEFLYEGNGDFLSLVTGNEAFELNKMFNVTAGNKIYKLSATNIKHDMYVIAKEINFEILCS